jgi:hypothetical protein
MIDPLVISFHADSETANVAQKVIDLIPEYNSSYSESVTGDIKLSSLGDGSPLRFLIVSGFSGANGVYFFAGFLARRKAYLV